jgi:hypothetical protein
MVDVIASWRSQRKTAADGGVSQSTDTAATVSALVMSRTIYSQQMSESTTLQ